MLFQAAIEIFKDYALFYETELGIKYPFNIIAVVVTTLGLVKLGLLFKDSLICRSDKEKVEKTASLLE